VGRRAQEETKAIRDEMRRHRKCGGAEGNGIGILEIFLIDALLSGIYRYI